MNSGNTSIWALNTGSKIVLIGCGFAMMLENSFKFANTNGNLNLKMENLQRM